MNEDTGEVTLTDRSALCAWVSSDPTKATVGAATGIITPVAAGETTVTATYDPADGVARADTVVVTVTA